MTVGLFKFLQTYCILERIKKIIYLFIYFFKFLCEKKNKREVRHVRVIQTTV